MAYYSIFQPDGDFRVTFSAESQLHAYCQKLLDETEQGSLRGYMIGTDQDVFNFYSYCDRRHIWRKGRQEGFDEWTQKFKEMGLLK